MHPRLYATTALAEQNCYERMQYGGIPENAAYTQYIPQGHAPVTVSSQGYMTAMPSTLMPVNSVNYTTANLGGAELTYADLGVMGAGGAVLGGVMPVKKMPYTTATLGRPPRHPDLKRHEPTIYAQVRETEGKERGGDPTIEFLELNNQMRPSHLLFQCPPSSDRFSAAPHELSA